MIVDKTHCTQEGACIDMDKQNCDVKHGTKGEMAVSELIRCNLHVYTC